MIQDVLQILDPGMGMTFQDQGRPGWKRFGMPRSGVMDDHAASWANQLLENPADAAVVELLFHGGRIRALQPVWIAVTGAAPTNYPSWRALNLQPGNEILFRPSPAGLWSYLAVEGGFVAPQTLHSASCYLRAGIGDLLARNQVLARRANHSFSLPDNVAGRHVAWEEQRDYGHPPLIAVWPGPQWDLFDAAAREKLFTQTWIVDARSDRVGYRLVGEPIASNLPELISEPVRTGSIQIPQNGLPIVTMRDGPTIGGYPKIGLVDPAALSWLTQCQPGHPIQFQPQLRAASSAP